MENLRLKGAPIWPGSLASLSILRYILKVTSALVGLALRLVSPSRTKISSPSTRNTFWNILGSDSLSFIYSMAMTQRRKNFSWMS